MEIKNNKTPGNQLIEIKVSIKQRNPMELKEGFAIDMRGYLQCLLLLLLLWKGFFASKRMGKNFYKALRRRTYSEKLDGTQVQVVTS